MVINISLPSYSYIAYRPSRALPAWDPSTVLLWGTRGPGVRVRAAPVASGRCLSSVDLVFPAYEIRGLHFVVFSKAQFGKSFIQAPEGSRRAEVPCECLGAAREEPASPWPHPQGPGWGPEGDAGTGRSNSLTDVQAQVVSISGTSVFTPVYAVCLCSSGPWSTVPSAVLCWASQLSAPPSHRATSG